MSFLDGVLGGLAGAGITSVLSHVIEENGGVQGLVAQFEQKGLGGVAQSWISTGMNQSISAEQISQVLGSDKVKQLAEKFGIPEDQIAAKLAEHLPAAMDKLTPDGAVPAAA